ncbi:unnamed protein product [Candida verbasci]|uniref:Uncharacterized protein n=1 Tax=Candida verbasci TaxID=1227364 RepID=A0A9W4TV30_9ASCO|nr:unnamed protein product [Candida verbasci]
MISKQQLLKVKLQSLSTETRQLLIYNSYNKRQFATLLNKKPKKNNKQQQSPPPTPTNSKISKFNYKFNFPKFEIDIIEKEAPITNIEPFDKSGLGTYIPELTSLHQEFNFYNFANVKELTDQIDNLLEKFHNYLFEWKEFTDPTYYKILVQLNRYGKLVDILNETKLSLNYICSIIEDPATEDYIFQEQEFKIRNIKKLASDLKLYDVDDSCDVFEICAIMAQDKPSFYAKDIHDLWEKLLDAEAIGFDLLAVLRAYKEESDLKYRQIDNWFRFENYIPEINYLKKNFHSFSNKDEVLKALDNLIQKIESDDVNIDNLLKLRTRMVEFANGNSIDCFEILNTVVLNNNIFEKFEKNKKVEKIVDNYVQIPNDSDIYNFTNELNNIKNVLGKEFKSVSSDNVLKALDSEINRLFAVQETASKFELSQLIRLKRRLGYLFEVNGGNTEVLDTLLNSQSVFEQFEKEKKFKDEYKQIPNDFLLEEFEIELKQLKKELGVDKFSDVKAVDVLKKSKYLAEIHGDVWHKLFRNLGMLFKHNRGETFVLDNVLISASLFNQFESSKEYKQLPENFNLEEFTPELIQLKQELSIETFASIPSREILNKIEQLSNDQGGICTKLYRNLTNLFYYNGNSTSILDNILINVFEFNKFKPSSFFSKHVELLTNKYKFHIIGKFLRDTRILYSSDVHKISRSGFEKLIDDYKSRIGENEREILNQLKAFNSTFDYYPSFLVCVYGTQPNENLLNSTDLEVFYNDLTNSLKNQEKIESENEVIIPIESNFDINNFKKEVKPNNKSHEEFESISELQSKEAEYKDEEKPIIKNEYKPETTNDEIREFKFRNNCKPNESQSESKTPYSNTAKLFSEQSSAFESPAEKDKIIYKPSQKIYTKPSKQQSQIRPSEFNSSKLEKYLEKLKIEEDGKKREIDALNFSHDVFNKSQLNKHKKNSKFISLTIDNDSNLISNELISFKVGDLGLEDLELVGNKDLKNIEKLIKKLDSKDWKLIGSKLEDDKRQLMFIKETNFKKKSKTWKFIKLVITTSGLIMLSLIGLNYVLEDPKLIQSPPSNPEFKPTEEEQLPFRVVSPKESEPVETLPISKPESHQLSWWQKLFWSK